MAWISHDPEDDKSQPKFFAFRKKFNWPPYQAHGFLCAFWINVLKSENYETGDISDWTAEFLADRIGIGNVDPDELWEALMQGYVEAKPDGHFLVRDWIKIAGPWLRQKYANRENGRERLTHIWALHGLIYGREHQTRKSAESQEKEGEESNESRAKVALQSGSNPPPNIINEPPQRQRLFPSGMHGSAVSPNSDLEYQDREDKKTATKGDPQVAFLTRQFKEQLDRVMGEPEVGFDYGSAGKVFKDMIAQGLTVEQIFSRFDPWFKSTDSWIVKTRRFNIREFKERFTQLKDGPIANQVGTNGASGGRKFYDGLATAGAEKEFPE